MVKKIIFGSCISLISLIALSATWTDSTGTSVVDGGGQDRGSRGTSIGSHLNNSIDMDSLQVMSGETSKALSDLGDLLGDDGEIVATCTTGKKNATVIECPTYAGASCQSAPNTGFISLTKTYARTYDLWSWRTGYGNYGPALTYKNNHVVSLLHFDNMPTLAQSKVTTKTVSNKDKSISITLNQRGYLLKINGQNATSGPVGDISFLGNTRFTNLNGSGNALSNIVANYPTVISPRFRFKYWTQSCTGSKGGCSSNSHTYESNISNSYNKNPYFRVGINNSYPAGKLVDIFSIYDIEHVTSGGKYTNTVRLSIENGQVKNGSNYYTFFEGFKQDRALLEYWGDNNQGESDFDDFHQAFSYSAGAAPIPVGSEIKTPFRQVLTCTFK